jgi:hypothetical protein
VALVIALMTSFLSKSRMTAEHLDTTDLSTRPTGASTVTTSSPAKEMAVWSAGTCGKFNHPGQSGHTGAPYLT